jgi:hypothetical protein
MVREQTLSVTVFGWQLAVGWVTGINLGVFFCGIGIELPFALN